MGRPTKYPYDQWIDGEWHEIHPSEYGKSLPSLRTILHQAAKSRHMLLSTRSQGDDTLAFVFRALGGRIEKVDNG